MVFWFIVGLLTLGASLAVLLPLAGRPRADSAASHDLEVYKDQLAELDSDAGRGLIGATEAEEARAEIARRIIRSNAAAGASMKMSQGGLRFLGAAAVLAVPLVSWGIYGAIGSPDLPGQPLRERLTRNPADSSVDELIARAEAHLAANPVDGRGWDVLAPVYLRLGRTAESVTAYRNAIQLEGATALREAGLGEAITAANGGLVSSDAQAAFERATRLEPDHPKARFFLASAMAQEGLLSEATSAWRSMLAELPSDAPWRGAVEQALADATQRIASSDESAVEGGPDQAEIDAAAAMSAADRNAMIETMVASLDQKLRANPNDPEGWMQLVRSYVVLGKTAKARDALARGLSALGAGTDGASRVARFADDLGLSATE